MAITIDPQLEQEIVEQARIHGYDSPSAYLHDLVKRSGAFQEKFDQTRGRKIVERLRGTASRRISADEIMAETRSEI